MAIQFARIEYVSRSSGGNACRKSAYNERSKVTCERTGEVFNWKSKSDLSHHEIMLPEGVSEKFKDSSTLWNAAEHAERRKDSQVAKESVIALPDDKVITHEDRIELSRRYADALFVSKGLAAQIDIHAPHDGEKNWHAHILVTTRGFSQDGESLATHKARETDPSIRKGYIKEEQNPGDIWTQIQNSYFKEKGYDLEVESTGIVAQIHMGPVRMRGHLTEVVARADLLKQSNEEAVRNPGAIIQKLTEKSSVFSEKDVDAILIKFVAEKDRQTLRDKIFNHKSMVSLYEKNSQIETGLFTTKEVRSEEERLLRFAAKVNEGKSKFIQEDISKEKGLSAEQDRALKHVLYGTKGLAIVQGRAGTGKSYTMNAIRESYERSGVKIIGLAPTHLVAGDMIKDGFESASTVHKFLFDIKNGKTIILKDSVFMVDEAAMLGNSVLVELLHVAKSKGSKVVLFGDSKQLSSVERGGMFESLSNIYGSAVLKEVRRQKIEWQKTVSEKLGEGAYKEAILALDRAKAIDWKHTREESMASLINAWSKNHESNPNHNRLILANKNIDVDALNRAVREIRLVKSEIDVKGYEVQTQRGKEVFSPGDRVAFTMTDKKIGVQSGLLGTIKTLDDKTCVVILDSDKEVTFDPEKYQGLKLGYASTIYKSQGKTIDEIYVLHDRSSNQKLSYVALSRQAKDLKVFVNTQETKSLTHLVSQISRDSRKISSLEFMTAEQLSQTAQNQNTQLNKIANMITTVVTSLKDKFYENDKFYQIKTPVQAMTGKESSVKPIDQTHLIKEVSDNKDNSLSNQERTSVQETLKKYRLESSFGKANHKTIESISTLKLTLQEINKSLGISDNPTETLQKATFMAMQIQKLATQHQSMTQDQINRRVSVAANLWMEYKDKAPGQKYGFNNDLIFMANKQIKTNDKSMDLNSSTKAQTLFREMAGITKDMPRGLEKIAGSAQLKLNERIQEIYKDQQANFHQQEQIRQPQRDQQKQFER
ncbi:MAG: AAA family ATPase [Candidatus Paracaedibacteraceae bacterium]|nr:AAA family ATPase [Candidatus Paracaedibacteraceae bacterium]